MEVSLQNLKALMEERNRDILTEHYGNVAKLCQLLQTDPQKGIPRTNADIRARVYAFGKNYIQVQKGQSFLRYAWEALNDFILFVLIAAALISLVLSIIIREEGSEDSVITTMIESGAILIAVVVIVLMTAINDWKKEKQFQSLQMQLEKDHRVTVLVNNEVATIPTKDLLVGDICFIKYGDSIPADGIVIHAKDLRIDESSMTGETNLVEKSANKDYRLMAGTNVMEGSGIMVVVQVGSNTISGASMALLEEEGKNISLIRAKLVHLTIYLGYAGLMVAMVTTLVLFGRFTFENYVNNEPWSMATLREYLNFFIFGVTILVLSIPEGLPLAVTLALAYSVKRMMSENILVRHLDACETMGNATAICSDKTGTLTTNRMAVVQCYLGGKLRAKDLRRTELSDKLVELLCDSIAINSSSTSNISFTTEAEKKAGKLPDYIGNKTECALLMFLEGLGISYLSARKNGTNDKIINVFTFNSNRKSMTTIYSPKSGRYLVLVKGASEILLEKCSYVYEGDDSIIKLEADAKARVRGIVSSMAQDSLRTICVAYREIKIGTASKRKEDEDLKAAFTDNSFDDEQLIAKHLILIGVFGIEDPLRPGVVESIALCQSAGITVRMVTGDNVDTARSVAIKCGIFTPGIHLIYEGTEFNNLIRESPKGPVVQELFDRIWPDLRVLARSMPQDKFTLVSGIIDSRINKYREVVAVTGDGTNDAPALKKADVGFAMGMAGTDVAKMASDIILVDDNFNGIVKSVMWGRNVYDSISKFLQFQLTVNVVAVLVSFLGVCFFKDSPLKAIQMLFLNLIMDTFASLALATDSPTKDILNRKSYGRTKPLISKKMKKNIIGHSIYQLTVIIGLLLYGSLLFDVDSAMETKRGIIKKHYVIVYNTFVLMTLFNEINCRKIRDEINVFSGIFRNKLFPLIWFSTLGTQIVIIQYGGNLFHTVSLGIDEWLWCLTFGFGEIIWGEVMCLFPQRFFCLLLVSEEDQEEDADDYRGSTLSKKASDD